MDVVAKSPADGYPLLMSCVGTHAINGTLNALAVTAARSVVDSVKPPAAPTHPMSRSPWRSASPCAMRAS